MKKIILALLVGVSASVSGQVKNCRSIYKVEGKESAYPRLSKDKKFILYQSNETGKWQLRILDMEKSSSAAVTKDAFNNNFPDWSADNKWIAFVSDRDGNEEIYVMKMDGSSLQRITNDPARDIHPYFSPDGKYILFNSTRGNGSFDIYRYTLETKKTDRLTATPENETCARYSPDMKQIVFLRNDDTKDDVYTLDLSSFLSSNLTNTPSTTDGWPMYSADGKWICYSSMESGTYCICRIRPDGSGKQQLTLAAPGEEDARVFISADSRLMIYNKKTGRTIEIMACELD